MLCHVVSSWPLDLVKAHLVKHGVMLICRQVVRVCKQHAYSERTGTSSDSLPFTVNSFRKMLSMFFMKSLALWMPN